MPRLNDASRDFVYSSYWERNRGSMCVLSGLANVDRPKAEAARRRSAETNWQNLFPFRSRRHRTTPTWRLLRERAICCVATSTIGVGTGVHRSREATARTDARCSTLRRARETWPATCSPCIDETQLRGCSRRAQRKSSTT